MKDTICKNIPFGAITSITSRGRFVFLNNRLRPFGLSAGQFPVLMLLSHEQNIMQEDLVRHYRLDKGTIARAVRKLEDAGYVRRITDPGNRRAVRLFLTEKGEQIVPVLAAIDSEWEERVCAGLDTGSREAVRKFMYTVAGNSFAILQNAGDDSHDRT